MSLQIGYIDSDGHPKVKIRVEGTNPGAAANIDAMIDTGFTGFLMLPISIALPLGLILMGTGDYSLADGSLITNYLAKGKVSIGYNIGAIPRAASNDPSAKNLFIEEVEGIILLGGEDALVGMEFLTSLDKMLMVGKVVLLLDQSEFGPIIANAGLFNPAR